MIEVLMKNFETKQTFAFNTFIFSQFLFDNEKFREITGLCPYLGTS